MQLKLKFIFNIAKMFEPRRLALRLALCALMLATPASAQSPQAPDSAKKAQVPTPAPASSPVEESTTIGDPADPAASAVADPESMLPHFKNSRFWLSGQANFIFQTHPSFPALYSGVHS